MLDQLVEKAFCFDLKNENPSVIHIVQPPFKVNLLIKIIDFIDDSPWSFIYVKPIKAKIQDDLFLHEVRTGKIKFSGGYKLHCSLLMEYDVKGEDVINEKYTILKVFSVF